MDVKDYSRFETQDKLDGYDTVLGYLAKNDPDEIDGMIDAVTDAIHLNRLCVLECKAQQRGFFRVQAPEVFQDAGIGTITAFPLSVLKKVLSV